MWGYNRKLTVYNPEEGSQKNLTILAPWWYTSPQFWILGSQFLLFINQFMALCPSSWSQLSPLKQTRLLLSYLPPQDHTMELGILLPFCSPVRNTVWLFPYASPLRQSHCSFPNCSDVIYPPLCHFQSWRIFVPYSQTSSPPTCPSSFLKTKSAKMRFSTNPFIYP